MEVDPSKLVIVSYPDPSLRGRAEAIEPSETVRAVAARMIELMREADGIGLAAPQVGLAWRLFVCRVPPEGEEGGLATGCETPQVHLNPVLSSPEGGLIGQEEGCLSLPGIRGEIRRPPVITLTSTDADGHEQTQRAAGLLARCWQHESDHLDGVLIIDKMPRMDRLRNRSAIRELDREWDGR